MPAPDARILAETAKRFFRSKGTALPEKWRQPGEQYRDAFAPHDRQVSPGSPQGLFLYPTPNRYHVTAAETVGRQLAAFIDAISAAVCGAIDKWLKAATINGVKVNGTMGRVAPGAIAGPPLAGLIMAAAPDRTPMETRYSAAVSSAVGQQWQRWAAGVSGMLIYPALAAVPGRMAPPTPNVPLPLTALPSTGEAAMTPSALKATMQAMLGAPQAQHATALFDALAKALGIVFQTFKSTTTIQNAMATGPVPSFAPPLVPAGPVMGGTVIPRPGILI